MKTTAVHILSVVTITGLVIALIALWSQQQQSKPVVKQDRIVTLNSVTLKASRTNYSWKLRQSALARTPVWNETEVSPPLAIRDAIKITDKVRDDLNSATVPQGVGGWKLEALTLSPLDGDYNRVERWCRAGC